jgi:hypothetical protein
MIAFLEARRAGLFARGQWLPNVIAGVIVGVVALPLAMAFAIASGARPEQGLYTAIVGGACVSLLGGSRVQVAGPTGAFVAILAGITARYGISGLETATLMAGVILVLMGGRDPAQPRPLHGHHGHPHAGGHDQAAAQERHRGHAARGQSAGPRQTPPGRRSGGDERSNM